LLHELAGFPVNEERAIPLFRFENHLIGMKPFIIDGNGVDRAGGRRGVNGDADRIIGRHVRPQPLRKRAGDRLHGRRGRRGQGLFFRSRRGRFFLFGRGRFWSRGFFRRGFFRRFFFYARFFFGGLFFRRGFSRRLFGGDRRRRGLGQQRRGTRPFAE